MFISSLAGQSTHRCDKCAELFVIGWDKPKDGQAPRFLIIKQGCAITHKKDDTHEANGLSYCGNCSDIIRAVMGLTFPRF